MWLRFFSMLGILFLASCEKDINLLKVSGLYTEISPVAGATQLNFISDTIMVRSDSGSIVHDSFRYTIAPGKIELTPTWMNQYPSVWLDFTINSPNSFTIENLNASIPEMPKTYMSFVK